MKAIGYGLAILFWLAAIILGVAIIGLVIVSSWLVSSWLVDDVIRLSGFVAFCLKVLFYLLFIQIIYGFRSRSTTSKG